MRRIPDLLVLAALLGLSLTAQAATQDTRLRANDTQLRDALEGIRLRHEVPGMAAALFNGEDVRVFAIGDTASDGDPITPSTRFRLGEVSEMFAGLAVAALDADGSLSAEADVAQLAPEIDLQNPWDAERPVTISDLLAHRAGLGRLRYRNLYTDQPGQPLLAGINRAYREMRVAWQPGERERHSALGPAIAAYLVEKAVDMPYERVLERMLFEPLEIPVPAISVESIASSRAHSGRPAREMDVLPLHLPPAGDIWMSAEALARFGNLLVNRGRYGERQVLPEQAVAWMEAGPRTRELVPGHRHGVWAEEHGGLLFFGQSGAMPGFLARFVYSPEIRQGYLLLLNHGQASAALQEADALLRGQLASGHPSAPAAGIEPPATLAGWYRNVGPHDPPRKLYQWWLGLARAADCGERLCLQGIGQPSLQLEAVGELGLRELGHWFPGWRVTLTETGHRLESATASWEPVDAFSVVGRLAVTTFLLSGIMLAVVMLPVWTFTLVKGRVTDYHSLVPRLLPLIAVLAFIIGQVMLFNTGYPELGMVSPASVAILVLTAAVPMLAALAVAAAVAGFAWDIPRGAAVIALYLAITAVVASIMLGMADLLAFQGWNY